jgi:predicted lipoprotein with Yx(FWY)xxD motif
MRRISFVLLFALFAVVAGGSASAVAGGSVAKLQLRKTKAGTILVNARGYTLYSFTRDKGGKDDCVKIHECLTAWPAVTTSGRPIAGPGVKSSLIGTINVPGVGTQVTYNRKPLYTFIKDSGPGDTSWIGYPQFGGVWPAVSAGGGSVY